MAVVAWTLGGLVAGFVCVVVVLAIAVGGKVRRLHGAEHAAELVAVARRLRDGARQPVPGPAATTSAGLTLAYTITEAHDAVVHHLSLCHRDGALASASAGVLAALIVQALGWPGVSHFFRGSGGVFHVIGRFGRLDDTRLVLRAARAPRQTDIARWLDEAFTNRLKPTAPADLDDGHAHRRARFHAAGPA